MTNPFARVIDSLYSVLGREAGYTPQGGASMAIKVMPKRPDQVVGFNETLIHSETTLFDLRASDIASPRPGDTITFDGTIYVIQGEPRREDPERLIWTVETHPL